MGDKNKLAHSPQPGYVLDRILDAAVKIRMEPDTPERDKAFMARQLVQVTLPHSNPGNNKPVWRRNNGNLVLSIRPGWDHTKNKPLGYPYGTIPRLLLFWLTTEALKTGRRRLALGSSLAAFMRTIGLDPSRGGPRSDAGSAPPKLDRFRQRLRIGRSARFKFTSCSNSIGGR